MNNSTKEFPLISSVVDKYFDFMIEKGGNYSYADFVPENMLLEARGDEEWAFWTPLKSTVDETQIAQLERLMKHPLPESYKFFLKQWHFVELMLGGYQVEFFSNLPAALAATFDNKIKENYPELIARNYLPFADLSDYGVACFDANKSYDGNEYPVVTFDHEDGFTEPQWYEHNFERMFSEFDSHLDDWIKHHRTIKGK